jgi:hypothetical protein
MYSPLRKAKGDNKIKIVKGGNKILRYYTLLTQRSFVTFL